MSFYVCIRTAGGDLNPGPMHFGPFDTIAGAEHFTDWALHEIDQFERPGSVSAERLEKVPTGIKVWSSGALAAALTANTEKMPPRL
jgi:hypothetical protein